MTAEVDNLRRSLTEVRERLLATIAGVSEEQFKKRPPAPSDVAGPNWCIAEVLAHLLQQERLRASRIALALQQDGVVITPGTDERALRSRARRPRLAGAAADPRPARLPPRGRAPARRSRGHRRGGLDRTTRTRASAPRAWPGSCAPRSSTTRPSTSPRSSRSRPRSWPPRRRMARRSSTLELRACNLLLSSQQTT